VKRSGQKLESFKRALFYEFTQNIISSDVHLARSVNKKFVKIFFSFGYIILARYLNLNLGKLLSRF